jgi:GMP synthase-like glutamine amidotransferase
MKIGILKTDTVRPEWVGTYGEYPDMFEALLRQVDPDLEFCTWDVEAGELPEDLSAVDGYIITGSKSSAYDDKPWIRALEDFIRHAHLVKVKLVGICFGHQLVARALGGLVDKSAKGWGCGVQVYSVSDAQLLADGEHILTFQGHPEFIPEYSRDIMALRREMIGEARVAEGLATLEKHDHQGERVARWMLDFIAAQ